MPTKKVIFRRFLDDAATYLVWVDVPTALQAEYANPTLETYAGATADELLALRNGEVRQYTIQVPLRRLTGTQTPDANAMWVEAESRQIELQAILNARGPLLREDAYWDGTDIILPGGGSSSDTTPPTFARPISVQLTSTTTATIDAETDQPCEFQAQYGTVLSGDFATTTTLTAFFAPTFIVSLTGLSAGVAYQARVYAINSEGRETTSAPIIFTMAADPPVWVTGPTLSQATATTALVTGTATPASTMTVYVNPTGSPSTVLTFGPTASATAQSQLLTGLTPGTPYQWRADLTASAITLTGLTSNFTTQAGTAPPPDPTGQVTALLSGPTGVVYTRSDITDSQGSSFLTLLDTEFWRRATANQVGVGIDIFQPLLPPLTPTVATNNFLAAPGGGGCDWLTHAYALYYITGNADYLAAANRVGEMASQDSRWTSSLENATIAFFNAGSGKSFALLSLLHPDAGVRAAARLCVSNYAYFCAKRRSGDFFDIREGCYEMEWMLAAYVIGLTTLQPPPGTLYVGPLDTQAMLSRKVDAFLANTNTTKRQQSDGGWLNKASGLGGGMEPELSFTANTTNGSKILTHTGGATTFAAIKTGLTVTGTGLPARPSAVAAMLYNDWAFTANLTSGSAVGTRAVVPNTAALTADMVGRPITGTGVAVGATVSNLTTGTAAGATTNNAGYAIGATTVTLASAGAGTILVGDNITFAGQSTTYRVTSGDADVSNGGTITFTPGLVASIPASNTAITVVAGRFTMSANATASSTAAAVTVLAKNPADSTFVMTQAATATAGISVVAGGMPDTRKKPFMDGLAFSALAWYAKLFPFDATRVQTAMVTAYRDASPGPIGWLAKTRDVDGTSTGGAPLDYSNKDTQLTPAYIYEVDGLVYYLSGAESATQPTHYASLSAWHIQALGWLYSITGDTAYQALANTLIKGMISTESSGRPTGGGTRELSALHWGTFNQFADALRNLAALQDVVSNPPPAPPASGTWYYSVGAEEVLNTQANKPYRFPDLPMGIVANASVSAPFAWFSGSSARQIIRTTGPLTNPAMNSPSPAAFINEANGTLISVPAEFSYLAGCSIHQYSPTKWVMLGYAENWQSSGGGPFRSSSVVLKSTNGGTAWTYVGQILKTQLSYAPGFTTGFNMCQGTHLTRDNMGVGAAGTYFYIYFKDSNSTGSTVIQLTVARCLVSAVETWIDGGATASFLKWDGGSFTVNGLTGLGTALTQPGNTDSHLSVAYNTYLQRYQMIGATGPAYPDLNIYIQDSADGFTWVNRQPIMTTPSRYEAKGTLIALDGSSQISIGQDFWVYYNTSNVVVTGGQSAAFRNTSDILARRRISLVGTPPSGPPPPATNTYNAAAQFSLTQGQSGFNYLYGSAGTPMTPDTPNNRWIGNNASLVIGSPLNESEILMHPGPNNTTQTARLRWTAPLAGTADITFTWRDKDPNAGGDGVTVRTRKSIGGTVTQLVNTTLADSGPPVTSTTSSLVMAQGDYIEIEIGCGPANNHQFDSTGVVFTVVLTL